MDYPPPTFELYVTVERSLRDMETNVSNVHCAKSVRIWSYSGPYFPAFGLNKERYYVFNPNEGKYGPE